MKRYPIPLLSRLLLLALLLVACVPVTAPTSPTAPLADTAQAGEPASPQGSLPNPGGDPIDYCVLSTDGTGYTSRGGGEGLEELIQVLEEEGISVPFDPDQARLNLELHGPGVRETLIRTLQAMGATPATASEGADQPEAPVAILVIDEFSDAGTPGNHPQPVAIELWTFQGSPYDRLSGEVLVASVDIQDFDLSQVADATAEAVTWLSNEVGVDQFVLNMSWVVVPCGEVAHDVEEYIERICEFPDTELDRLEDLQAIKVLLELLAAFDQPVFSLADLCGQINGSSSPFDALSDEARAKVNMARILLYSSPELGRALLRTIYDHEGAQGDTFFHWISHPRNSRYGWLMECLVAPETGEFCQNVRRDGQQFIPIAAAGNLDLEDGARHPGSVMFPYAPALWDAVISVGDSDPQAYLPKRGEIAMKGLYREYPELGITVEGTSYAAPRLAVWAATYLLQVRDGTALPCETDHVPVLGYAQANKQSEVQDLTLQEALSEFCEPYELLEPWPEDFR